MKFIFTSEAVTEGHPDKVADRIADSILDEILKQDPMARVACECVTAPELVFIFGEITTNAHVDFEKIARDTVKEIGYTKEEYGFDYKNMKVVATGGLGSLIADETESIEVYDRQLTLEGLKMIYDRNR